MASSAMFKLFCVGMMALLVLAPHAEAAISCSAVVNKLYPCLGYFNNNGPITSGCCAGIRGLLNQARSTPDRQAVCGCLKTLAANPVYVAKAGGLLRTCRVSLPYPLNPNIDCSRVT